MPDPATKLFAASVCWVWPDERGINCDHFAMACFAQSEAEAIGKAIQHARTRRPNKPPSVSVAEIPEDLLAAPVRTQAADPVREEEKGTDLFLTALCLARRLGGMMARLGSDDQRLEVVSVVSEDICEDCGRLNRDCQCWKDD